MLPALMSRRLPFVVALGVVAFAFWPALFAGGSLVSADIVATAPPFDAYQPVGFEPENGPGDPINIHAHWGSLADDVRSGDVGWWMPDLAGGQPTMKGGLPVFNLPYLAVPAWFAPGLVAAIRALTAIGLMFGFLRSVELSRVSALVGGLAFGFSGFMVGWMNWPHSSVAALAPGLLWATERIMRDPRPWRALPLGLVTAAMVWANFPSVLIYVLLGAVAFAGIRLIAERGPGAGAGWVGPRVGVGLIGIVVAGLLAGPHLIGFSEYLGWADTSHRIGSPADSSAGVEHLLTAVAPAVWGSDAVGAPWFGEGNWVEFNAHAGASVVLLGVLGLVAAIRGGDRLRRSVSLGLLALIALGLVIAYVGGPVGVALGDLTGSQGGLMTRAKVLWSIGIAAAAALGTERLVTARGSGLRRDVAWACAALGGLSLVLVPSILDWLDEARRLGVVRDTIAASTAPILAASATVALVVARTRRRISTAVVGGGLVVVVAFELLSFAMPVPTIADRDQRLSATPAHDELRALLRPGERLAGEGRTFFPSTTQLFDIDDARGQVLKSAGYQALLRAVDPDMVTVAGGGTPTYPNVAAGTDPRTSVWDALGVGAWAQFPDEIPVGDRDDPTPVPGDVDPSIRTRVGATTVPDGGLRAVLFRVNPLVGGIAEITVTTDDGTYREERWLEPSDIGVIGVAVLGEHLRVGSPVRVEVSAPASTLLVSADDDGAMPVGTVAGGDGLELVRVGDVVLFDRPVEPVRLVDAANVASDLDEAAALVAGRTDDRTAVTDRGVGLPDTPDPEAMLRVEDVVHEPDAVTLRASTDRAAMLVVSRAHYPGWTATVDGAPAEVVVADGAFLGVPIGPGEHEIVLTFRPDHLGMSLVLLLAGLVVVAALLVDAHRRGDLRSSRRSPG